MPFTIVAAPISIPANSVQGFPLLHILTNICYFGGHADLGHPRWCSGEESACQCRRRKRCELDPSVGKIPWSRTWQPTPVFLPGKFHGQRRLAGYSPWGWKERT